MQAGRRAGDRETIVDVDGAGPRHVGVSPVVPIAANTIAFDQSLLGRGRQQHLLDFWVRRKSAHERGPLYLRCTASSQREQRAENHVRSFRPSIPFAEEPPTDDPFSNRLRGGA